MRVIMADFLQIEHQDAVFDLLNEYLNDKMGLGRKFSPDKKIKLITGLKTSPSCLVFLVRDNDEYIAMAVCYSGFSTFKLKKFLNIHDVIVRKTVRKKGIGEFLMRYIIDYAEWTDMGKVTLEVRKDNRPAKQLYKKLGFSECNIPMHFWVKDLEHVSCK